MCAVCFQIMLLMLCFNLCFGRQQRRPGFSSKRKKETAARTGNGFMLLRLVYYGTVWPSRVKTKINSMKGKSHMSLRSTTVEQGGVFVNPVKSAQEQILKF